MPSIGGVPVRKRCVRAPQLLYVALNAFRRPWLLRPDASSVRYGMVCTRSCAKCKSTTAARKAVPRKEPMERRLAAIVCADIAGYARLMGADEAGTHASFKAHRSAIYPIILNHGGRLVKNTGDGFLLEFASIVGAIEAAIAMQTVMAERNHHLPADRVMHFRIGVHMGDVMADEDEVFGDDVNIAVRLETV